MKRDQISHARAGREGIRESSRKDSDSDKIAVENLLQGACGAYTPLEMYLLSEDMNAKIKACKTEEEMMKVLGEEGNALDDDLPDSPGGGYGDGTHRKKQQAYTALNREKTILFSGFLAYLV